MVDTIANEEQRFTVDDMNTIEQAIDRIKAFSDLMTEFDIEHHIIGKRTIPTAADEINRGIREIETLYNRLVNEWRQMRTATT